MARIRTVKPEFWIDEKIGRLKRDVRLLFIGLWNLADDQGVIKSNAAYIKGQLFSYDDDLRGDTVNVWLASLVKARMLVPFTFDGEGYYVIRTFSEHQLINRPSKAKFPEELLLSIKNTHGVISDYSQPEGKGKEGKGKEQGSGEIENSVKNSEKKKIEPGPQITMPFGEDFFFLWTQWKLYKKAEHRFFYKSPQSEQAAISELVNLAAGKEETASAIIKQSMAKGWKGFFELKDLKNESVNKNGHSGATKVNGQQLHEATTKFYKGG